MNTKEIAQRLNESVVSVISQENLIGFEKAYLLAESTARLKEMLTTQYMKPIMQLQGSRLGFKTDKDTSGGYSEAIVKNCLIEAVLSGVQPFGNQFNIIANNMYITKEGYGYLLKNIEGLSYNIKHSLPRIDQAKGSSAIVMNIEWSMNGGVTQKHSIDIPVKVNKFMGTDAVIGKALRKSRKWLYETITGSETSDGDIIDHDGFVKAEVINAEDVAEAKERQRIIEHIKEAKTLKSLQEVSEHINIDDEEMAGLYEQKFNEFENKK